MSFEQTFASTTLDVAVPDTSLDFPTQDSLDSWLDRIGSGLVDRKQSFFDEQLRTFLVVRVKNPPPESDGPPQTLLSFLAHLQVSFEATYISTVPDTQEDTRVPNVISPPRASSLPKANSNPRLSLHPSILPPHTPNPTPTTTEHDRKYVASEGTLLLAGIWGQNPSQDANEDFRLLWSSSEQLWVAVYSFSLTVSYLRLNVSDPLLCLTVSATLRDKPITTASSKHPLALYFAEVGGQSCLIEPEIPGSTDGNDKNQPVEEEELNRLEEVNLLQGLHGGPEFGAGSSTVSLPSTRLGIVSRQKMFSLPPINLPSAQPPELSPMTALRAVHPTLRKSFRKTLGTASGFRVRMRTVFVPYMLLSRRVASWSDNGEDERDKREAGNEERTIVLCIEIENSSESGPHIGFEVEKVDVQVGGGDAEAHLIAWGEASFLEADESKIFPLRINSSSQYNLLYAVWFLHPPDELNTLPFAGNHGAMSIKSDLQRAVAIYIHGKPYEKRSQSVMTDDAPALLYPTQTFSSRWNCVLDLGVRDQQNLDIIDTTDPSNPTNKYPNVLPEPASPFPLSSARSGGFTSPSQSPATTPRSSLIAGTQRLSLPKTPILGRPFTPVKTPRGYSDQQFTPPPSARQSYVPPSQSLAAAAQLLHSPTTYNAPTTLPGLLADEGESSDPPLTPAYPPHSPYLPSLMSQGPITAQGAGSVGPSVETRRERGSGLGLTSAISPTTPIPNGSTLFADQHQAASNKVLQQKLESGQSIVISVRLISPRDGEGVRDMEDIDERIYPLSRFSIEVFVFNRSTWTRRFELSYPNTARSKRRERVTSRHGEFEAPEESKNKPGYPGILPVDNRVRIGPLLPSACQTVRMQFFAVTPGVHSIDALTLTDIETGYSMNLRSVMDVVVHEFT
ncbi:TRAPP trafficking subunit Trs65 domain containing protein [Amanita muscaria]